MKVKKILNSSESVTRDELEKALAGSGYRIFPQQLIRDVINLQLADLRYSDRAMYKNGKFDFVICDAGSLPEFAVEFDGPNHFLYAKKMEQDIRKNRICSIAQFPLLRVSDAELDQYDSISVVQFVAYRFVNWKKEYPRIQQEIQSEVEEMTPEEIQHLTRGGILDPSLDPTFRFDLDFPFPLTRNIQMELLNNYGLGLHSPDQDGIKAPWFTASVDSSFPDDGRFFTSYSYGIYRGKSSDGRYSWSAGHLVSPSVEILHEGQVKFGMKWELVIAEDYDQAEAPISYAERNGYLPIYFADIPGGHIPSICEAVCEYIAYKKVREWAQNNLKAK